MKNIILWSITLVYALIAYLFIFGVLSFLVHFEVPSYLEYDVNALRQYSIEDQHVYLVEERQFALDIRLALIAHAQEQIDISYYALHDGDSSDIFFGSLLTAAQRGVEIRFILDGFIEGRGINDSTKMMLLASHPNITIAHYEVFDIKAPYAVQNRLHDKLLIVDNKYGLIGGRNIGDRYFFDDPNLTNLTHDRDILVFGEPSKAVEDMSEYYDILFNSPYSSVLDSKENHQDYSYYLEDYENYLTEQRLNLPELIDRVYQDAFLVDNVTFLRSPLNRMNKEPVIFNTLIELSHDYDDFIIQSPYLIFSRPMRAMFSKLEYDDMVILTNHPYTNPNIFAVSGYLRIREELVINTRLFEYQKPLSLHTKTIIMGDDISVIGSLNIDPRSAYLSTESVVVIYDEAFNLYLRSVIDDYLEDSLEVSDTLNYLEGNIDPIEISNTRRIIAHIFKYLTYFFDEML